MSKNKALAFVVFAFVVFSMVNVEASACLFWKRKTSTPTIVVDEKWAVVIGTDYNRELNTFSNDAKLMAKELLSEGYTVKLLTNEQATVQAVKDAIVWLCSVEDADDGVVIFFSCHSGDTGVWLYNGNILPSTLSKIFMLDSNYVVMVFQGCYSGIFISYLKKDGRIIVTSASVTQLSYNLPWLGYSEFGYYFVKPLLSNKSCTVEEAYAYAKLRMRLSRPQISDNILGNYLI